jgi:CHAT domain-containing protein/tetratricopeptide (TPR) repeat protein
VDAAARRFSSDPEWYARFRVQKAHVLIFRGSYKDALQLLQPGLPPSLAQSDIAVRRKLLQGSAYDYTQKFDLAQSSLQEAEHLARSSHPELLAEVELAVGALAMDRKTYSGADSAFRLALAASRQHDLPYLEASVLGSLGNLAMRLEQYDEAIDWYRAALQKSQALGMQSTAAITLGNIGWNYSAMGDFDNAEAMFKRAVEASAKAGLTGDRIYWLNSLGDVYAHQRRYEEAQAASQTALALARKGDDKGTLTQCLNTLSEIALDLGNLDSAESYNREAIQIEQAGLDRTGSTLSQLFAGRIQSARDRYPEAAQTLRQLIADPAADASTRWQAQAALARVFVGENQPAEAERQFRSAISTIQSVRSSIQNPELRLPFLTSAIEFYDAYIDFLIARNRPVDALAVAELSRSQAFSDNSSASALDSTIPPAHFDPRKIAARSRSILLFYSLGISHSYLWVISAHKVSLLSLPPQQEIDVLAKSYRESLINSPLDPLSSSDSPGAKLYSILIGPASKLIPPDARVIVLPDAALTTFNFETLVVPSPKPHYWIEDATLSVANSLDHLSLAGAAPRPRNASLLLMGDAIPTDLSFPSLPQAPAEIRHVESYFQQSRRDVLTGTAATAPNYFASHPGRFQFIHFVTHGIASRLQPLESAIILSRSGDSYKLYAHEIVTHPLHADLVTISACTGAGNREYAGEGLVGLSWAFLRAGARNVISALWEVSDASTPKLMDSLYRGLNQGEDPATALRNAQLQLLHSSGVYSKPYYWAPFQLYTGS